MIFTYNLSLIIAGTRMILLNKFMPRKCNAMYYYDYKSSAYIIITNETIDIVSRNFTYIQYNNRRTIYRGHVVLTGYFHITIFILNYDTMTCESWPEQKELYKKFHAECLKRKGLTYV